MKEFNRAEAGYRLVAFVVIAIVINATMATSGCVIGELLGWISSETCKGQTILEAFSLAISTALGYAAGASGQDDGSIKLP